MATFRKLNETSLQEYINNKSAVLDIVENPKTGKVFFACAGEVGAIGAKALEALKEGADATELRMAKIQVLEDDGTPSVDEEGKNIVLLCIQARGTTNVLRSFKPTV